MDNSKARSLFKMTKCDVLLSKGTALAINPRHGSVAEAIIIKKSESVNVDIIFSRNRGRKLQCRYDKTCYRGTLIERSGLIQELIAQH